MGIGADPHHRAALLIHTDQQRDAGVRRGGVLVALDGLDQAVGSLVRCVPAEEDVASQMIGAHVRDRFRVRHPDKKQLSHFFLQSHGGKQVLHLLGGQFFRCGLWRGILFLGLGVGIRHFRDIIRRGAAAGGQGEQQESGQCRRQKAFHRCSFPDGRYRYQQCTIFSRERKDGYRLAAESGRLRCRWQ